MSFSHDIAVVGVGRIGLPLLLTFAAKEQKIIGVDKNEALIASLERGKMPFQEGDASQLLARYRRKGTATFTTQLAAISAARDIIITIGSIPLLRPEEGLSDIVSVIKSLLPYFQSGQHIVLRGTVTPGTTDKLAWYIQDHTAFRLGDDLFLSCCPERTSEGHFFQEIEEIPQIIGSFDKASEERALKLFALLGGKKLVTSPLHAELAKVWSNVLRYANFALPNLLLAHCEEVGADIFDVIELINTDYPRGNMAQPGLTGGLCLRKDFLFVEEVFPSASTLLSEVFHINERTPLFLVDGTKKRVGPLKGCKVAVLGLTFKAESDDTRDALSAKVVESLKQEFAEVHMHDPFVPSSAIADTLYEAKVVIIATNHNYYQSAAFRKAFYQLTDEHVLLVDIWNCFGTKKVFHYPKSFSHTSSQEVGV